MFIAVFIQLTFNWLHPSSSRNIYFARFKLTYLFIKLKAVFVRFSLGGGGVRGSIGYDWPSDYSAFSGHGGCQIGKRRIVGGVVHKYTGLARKWNRGGGFLGGLESTPQRGFAELSGGSTTACGGQTPWPSLVKYSPDQAINVTKTTNTNSSVTRGKARGGRPPRVTPSRGEEACAY